MNIKIIIPPWILIATAFSSPSFADTTGETLDLGGIHNLSTHRTLAEDLLKFEEQNTLACKFAKACRRVFSDRDAVAAPTLYFACERPDHSIVTAKAKTLLMNEDYASAYNQPQHQFDVIELGVSEPYLCVSWP